MVNLTVHAVTVKGDSWNVSVDHKDTLRSLGDKLEEMTGYIADYMYFFHDRKGLLEHHRTFEDYNIRPQSLVDLLLRFGGKEPLGGCPTPDPVEWYNDPIPPAVMEKFTKSKEDFFGNMLESLEAQFARQMGYSRSPNREAQGLDRMAEPEYYL